MKKSKYLNYTCGDWTCTYVGVARVQPSFLKNSRTPSKRAHHQTYYYIFERRTSDDKADKMIRLSAKEACQVYRKQISVEEIAEARKAKLAHSFAKKVSYHFIDKF